MQLALYSGARLRVLMGIYLSLGFYDSFFQVMPFQLLGKVVPKVILRPPS